jgi:DNA-binding transcriptional LysR family regulator
MLVNCNDMNAPKRNVIRTIAQAAVWNPIVANSNSRIPRVSVFEIRTARYAKRARIPGVANFRATAAAACGSPSQVSSLIESRLDAGILRMPVSNPRLTSVPLFSEYLVLATAAEVPLRPKQTIRRLRNSGFIFVSRSVSETFHDRVLSLCLRAGFSPRVVQEANELLTILHLVRAGVGFLWSRGRPCASKCRECGFMN